MSATGTANGYAREAEKFRKLAGEADDPSEWARHMEKPTLLPEKLIWINIQRFLPHKIKPKFMGQARYIAPIRRKV